MPSSGDRVSIWIPRDSESLEHCSNVYTALPKIIMPYAVKVKEELEMSEDQKALANFVSFSGTENGIVFFFHLYNIFCSPFNKKYIP